MARTIFTGKGTIVYNGCPKCRGKISVFLREGETYRDARCMHCKAEVYADNISGIIREGRSPVQHLSKNRHASRRKSYEEVAAYDKGASPHRHETIRRNGLIDGIKGFFGR
ncbi:MAG: hypothetical protein JW724_07275 [Candidatus Altiarchaeota archaeon]|nr:hypothetical protein [Candidatus Altiarchaeota archaeon]